MSSMENLKKIELELEKQPVFTCFELLKNSLKIIVRSLYLGIVLAVFLFLVLIYVFGMMGKNPSDDFAVIYLIFFLLCWMFSSILFFLRSANFEIKDFFKSEKQRKRDVMKKYFREENGKWKNITKKEGLYKSETFERYKKELQELTDRELLSYYLWLRDLNGKTILSFKKLNHCKEEIETRLKESSEVKTVLYNELKIKNKLKNTHGQILND